MTETQQQEIDRLLKVLQQIYHMSKKGRFGHYNKEQTLYEICCLAGRQCKQE